MSKFRLVGEDEIEYYRKYNGRAEEFEKLMQAAAPGISIKVDRYDIAPEPIGLSYLVADDDLIFTGLYRCRAWVFIKKDRFAELVQWHALATVSEEMVEMRRGRKIDAAAELARAFADELKYKVFLGEGSHNDRSKVERESVSDAP